MNHSHQAPPHQPYQHPPQKQGMSAGKVVLIVLGTIAALAFGSCAVCATAVGSAANDIEKNAKEREAKRGIEKAEFEASVAACKDGETIPWAQISSMLKDNEAKTVNLWKGNCAKVSGVVSGVDSDFRNKPVVKIGTGKDFEVSKLMCSPVDEQKAFNLSKGQTITVWGVGGDEIIGSLGLDQCDW